MKGERKDIGTVLGLPAIEEKITSVKVYEGKFMNGYVHDKTKVTDFVETAGDITDNCFMDLDRGSNHAQILRLNATDDQSFTKDTYVNFHNSESGRIRIEKESINQDTPRDTVFTITGPNGYKRDFSYALFKNNVFKLGDLEYGTYTITEKNADVDGYVLKLTGDTTFKLSNGDMTDVHLTNTYTKGCAVKLEANKVLKGRNLTDKDVYEFEVLQGNTVVAKGKNDAKGHITFDPIELTKLGTYKYTIREVNGGKTINHIRYDKNEYQVTVEIKENENGKYYATVKYPEGGITFQNTALKTKTYWYLEEDGPSTGDYSAIGLYFVLFMMSIALIVFLKKNKDRNKEI